MRAKDTPTCPPISPNWSWSNCQTARRPGYVPVPAEVGPPDRYRLTERVVTVDQSDDVRYWLTAVQDPGRLVRGDPALRRALLEALGGLICQPVRGLSSRRPN